MKKLLAFSLLSSSIFFSANSVKADWDYYGLKKVMGADTEQEAGLFIDLINSKNRSIIQSFRYCDSISGPPIENKWNCFNGDSHYFNSSTGELIINTSGSNFKVYDFESNSLTENASSNWETPYNKGVFLRPTTTVDSQGNKTLEITGSKLIEKKSTGEVHIGENSAVFKEEGGREKFWAQDGNGKSIPIDITNGSKLLINGRDVEQSINNVGALSAALTGLPTVPNDTTLSCGLGTGTHGGDFAFSGGCASKVNEKLSINYAASMTMPGQDYAGDFEDTFSARAGFVWQLGKTVKPTLISIKTNEKMEDKINSLEEKNEKILSKNQKLEKTVSTLLARLERLEKVALGESKSKDLVTIKLP